LAVDNVICKNKQAYFFGPPCIPTIALSLLCQSECYVFLPALLIAVHVPSVFRFYHLERIIRCYHIGHN